MADTQRSLSDLLTTIFQDGQPAGSITPQDIRDFLVSVSPPHGAIGVQDNVTATVVSVAGTFTKILGTTTFKSAQAKDFDDDTAVSNRLRYTGTVLKHVFIDASISMTAASNNQILAFKIWFFDDSAASGSYLDDSRVRIKVGTGTDVGSISIHADIEMETNDYIELHLTNETSTSNVTVEELYMRVVATFQ